ncbi:hypothetical protein NKI01_26905 [Mesorhizobium sp. M0815]|uniref:hypothetical protein n=1 Tax=Mesorhizobium sp. M0815 TaxID=2957005 RepID=UPI00333CD4B0
MLKGRETQTLIESSNRRGSALQGNLRCINFEAEYLQIFKGKLHSKHYVESSGLARPEPCAIWPSADPLPSWKLPTFSTSGQRGHVRATALARSALIAAYREASRNLLEDANPSDIQNAIYALRLACRSIERKAEYRAAIGIHGQAAVKSGRIKLSA